MIAGIVETIFGTAQTFYLILLPTILIEKIMTNNLNFQSILDLTCALERNIIYVIK